jgi:DNA-binding transcriptional MerR regulator
MNSQGGSAPQVQKIYFRIGEVASIIGLEPSVIRHWETEFRRTLRPTRSRSGQRTYTQNDVRKIRQIKHLLYDKRFTIEGAKKVLREGGADEIGADDPPPVEQPRVQAGLQQALRDMRKEGSEFLAWLDAQATP